MQKGRKKEEIYFSSKRPQLAKNDSLSWVLFSRSSCSSFPSSSPEPPEVQWPGGKRKKRNGNFSYRCFQFSKAEEDWLEERRDCASNRIKQAPNQLSSKLFSPPSSLFFGRMDRSPETDKKTNWHRTDRLYLNTKIILGRDEGYHLSADRDSSTTIFCNNSTNPMVFVFFVEKYFCVSRGKLLLTSWRPPHDGLSCKTTRLVVWLWLNALINL